MKEIIIATKNAHKVYEFKAMLEPLGYTVKSLLDLDEDIEIEETGQTFAENATIKSKALYDVLHQEVISDDSGICIDFFDGGPGVYSSRWLGEETSYIDKNDYILNAMKDSENRHAKYVCSMCHIEQDGTMHVYTGECHGEIAYAPCGENGFGYDPIFYYPEYGTTLANVSDEKKNQVSHRHQALMRLLEGMQK